ncbi:MAG TPA: hypothetical protein PLO50_05910 [Nitrospira sp.]|nr:hypothetical protein [Nitrospira sp.]
MKRRIRLSPPTPTSIATYVKKHAAFIKANQRHHHPATSIREAEYKGHHIVIRTTYDIRVDGKRVTGHFGVGNNGQVHYHPIPNMRFASAVDMVKQLINVFPDEYTGKGTQRSGKKGSTPRRVRRTRKQDEHHH